jgi:hypothetical protein
MGDSEINSEGEVSISRELETKNRDENMGFVSYKNSLR